MLLEGHGCPGCRGGSGRQTTCEEIEEGFRIRAEILEALNIDYARNQGAPLQRHGDEVVETYVWIHDRTGRRLSQEHRDLRSGRRNVERYVHDDRDRVIEIQAADPGNSRRRILYRRLDEQGNLLRLEEDFAGDGSLDRIYEYTYDEEGRGLTQATDRDGDGAFEMRCTFVEPCRPPPPFRCPMRCEDGP